jgi:hypothetical protein
MLDVIARTYVKVNRKSMCILCCLCLSNIQSCSDTSDSQVEKPRQVPIQVGSKLRTRPEVRVNLQPAFSTCPVKRQRGLLIALVVSGGREKTAARFTRGNPRKLAINARSLVNWLQGAFHWETAWRRTFPHYCIAFSASLRIEPRTFWSSLVCMFLFIECCMCTIAAWTRTSYLYYFFSLSEDRTPYVLICTRLYVSVYRVLHVHDSCLNKNNPSLLLFEPFWGSNPILSEPYSLLHFCLPNGTTGRPNTFKSIVSVSGASAR